MVVRLWSRNTMIKNMSDVTMKVDVMVHPGNFPSEASPSEIPAGEHRYICYADIGIEYNPDRDFEVLAYFEGAQEKDKKSISPSEIRDNARIELNYLSGTVTALPIKGKMIAMNGAVIVMKSTARKMIKTLWKSEDH
ncbi:uncharacterized protein LOC121249101 [Juglans microcarpa x Juglans regia]|uniref:uncharacterized protein LOC121249101 n=1 Tax=Juglans microcarpa x Juglans regia TaxID=2249226 RepID=UPI001B7E37BD|nr:uncharacterized protein LOC121249101 [Juglans microcarpa x Juglans regia]